MNRTPPYKGIADQLAQHGRYGDDALIHVSGAELEGISALAPGGKLPVNPSTGQPEAFAFLLPMIASMGASSLAGGAVATGLGVSATMGSAIAGGIGSGLATTAMTGDLKRGLVSGVVGAGLGAATGAAGAASAGESAALDAAVPSAFDSAGAAQEIMKDTVFNAPELAAQQAAQEATSSGIGAINVPSVQSPMASSPLPNPDFMSGAAPVDPTAAYAQMTPGARAMAPIREPGAFTEQIMKPSTMLPMALGVGQLGEWDTEEQWAEESKEREAENEAKRREAYDDLQRGYRTAQPGAPTGRSPERDWMSRRTPPPMYAEGGQTQPGYGGIDPVTVQSRLRGKYSVAPPPGFMPGFSPEFKYFQDDPNMIETPPITGPKDWSKLYEGSPINRFDPKGKPYFESIIDKPKTDGGTGNISQERFQKLAQMLANMRKKFSQGPAESESPAESGGLPPGYYLRGTEPPGSTTGEPPVITGREPPVSTTQPVNRVYPSGGGNARPSNVRRHKFAEGGDVMLNTPVGEVPVAAGGIANIENQFTEPRDEQPDEQDLEMLAMAVMGQVENADGIIEAFIQKYGVDMFRAAREMILQSMQPGSQTEGMVAGQGGGMDDQVPGVIGDQQPVAVSPGEYIVPADVVSGLGDGSSDSGAAELDQMMSQVRAARQGGIMSQPEPIDAQRYLPR